ncbi:unnamed protein product, partial [Meganyctiphanes norvegica]
MSESSESGPQPPPRKNPPNKLFRRQNSFAGFPSQSLSIFNANKVNNNDVHDNETPKSTCAKPLEITSNSNTNTATAVLLPPKPPEGDAPPASAPPIMSRRFVSISGLPTGIPVSSVSVQPAGLISNAAIVPFEVTTPITTTSTSTVTSVVVQDKDKPKVIESLLAKDQDSKTSSTGKAVAGPEVASLPTFHPPPTTQPHPRGFFSLPRHTTGQLSRHVGLGSFHHLLERQKPRERIGPSASELLGVKSPTLPKAHRRNHSDGGEFKNKNTFSLPPVYTSPTEPKSNKSSSERRRSDRDSDSDGKRKRDYQSLPRRRDHSDKYYSPPKRKDAESRSRSLPRKHEDRHHSYYNKDGEKVHSSSRHSSSKKESDSKYMSLPRKKDDHKHRDGDSKRKHDESKHSGKTSREWDQNYKSLPKPKSSKLEPKYQSLPRKGKDMELKLQKPKEDDESIHVSDEKYNKNKEINSSSTRKENDEYYKTVPRRHGEPDKNQSLIRRNVEIENKYNFVPKKTIEIEERYQNQRELGLDNINENQKVENKYQNQRELGLDNRYSKSHRKIDKKNLNPRAREIEEKYQLWKREIENKYKKKKTKEADKNLNKSTRQRESDYQNQNNKGEAQYANQRLILAEAPKGRKKEDKYDNLPSRGQPEGMYQSPPKKSTPDDPTYEKIPSPKVIKTSKSPVKLTESKFEPIFRYDPAGVKETLRQEKYEPIAKRGQAYGKLQSPKSPHEASGPIKSPRSPRDGQKSGPIKSPRLHHEATTRSHEATTRSHEPTTRSHEAITRSHEPTTKSHEPITRPHEGLSHG